MSEFKPRRLTPEESANAWAEGGRRSAELRQQTAKMRLPPVGLEAEITQLRLQLAAADQVAAELRAEVNQWREAVRWVHDDDHGSTLKVGANPKRAIAVGGTTQYSDGTWSAWPLAASELGEVFSDRNTACAKVCELLGIPVVLPVGGE